MTSTARLLLLILVLGALTALPAARADQSADDKSVSAGLACYESGDYLQASKHFSEAIEENPDSYHNHYLLANCYTKLRRYADARHEYESCIQHGAPARVVATCKEAIERLIAAQSSQSQSGSKSIADDDGKPDTNAPPLVQQAQAQIKHEEKLFEDRRRKLEEDMNIQLSTVPKTIFRPALNSRRTGADLAPPRELPNPDYVQLEKELRAEMDAKVAVLQKELQRRSDELLKDAQSRTESLGNAAGNLKGQGTTVHSSAAVHERTSGAYVRNYVINGGPGELIIEPLRAAPAKSAPPAPSAKSQLPRKQK